MEIYNLAWEQAFVVTAAGCTFLRLLEDLRRVRERLSGPIFLLQCVAFVFRSCLVNIKLLLNRI